MGLKGRCGSAEVDSRLVPGRGLGGVSRYGPQASTNRGEIICYYCQQPDHKASGCPLKKPKLSGYCYVPHREVCIEPGTMRSEDASFHPVTVNGVQVLALLDNGSSMSLINAI